MRKGKLGILLVLLCLLVSGMTGFAETKTFSFVIKPSEYDAGNWTAEKADSEQRAYITPTSISGSGRVWAAVYDKNGGTQYTYDVAIEPGGTYRHTSDYYKTGYAKTIYRLLGGDNEWEVTSNTFTVAGRWTP